MVKLSDDEYQAIRAEREELRRLYHEECRLHAVSKSALAEALADTDTYVLREQLRELTKTLSAAKSDDPTLDATDAAKPSWWRGYDYGVSQIVRAMTEVLDGKEPAGTCAEPYETLRRRVWEAREDSNRLRVALEEVLDSLGALSKPNELDGWGIGIKRALEIVELSKAKP